jgi:Protein of unknown function (DUF2917)
MTTSAANKRHDIRQAESSAEAVRVSLSEGELFTMPGDRRGTRLEGLAGGLWVTQSGDPEDHWLPAGQTFVISRKGKVVVTGMPHGLLRVR